MSLIIDKYGELKIAKMNGSRNYAITYYLSKNMLTNTITQITRMNKKKIYANTTMHVLKMLSCYMQNVNNCIHIK